MFRGNAVRAKGVLRVLDVGVLVDGLEGDANRTNNLGCAYHASASDKRNLEGGEGVGVGEVVAGSELEGVCLSGFGGEEEGRRRRRVARYDEHRLREHFAKITGLARLTTIPGARLRRYLTNKRLYLTCNGGQVDADKVIDIGDIELVSQPGRDTVACVKGAVAKRANKAARDWLLSFYDGDALAHFMYHLVCLRGSLDCVTITVEEHLPKWVTKQVRTGMTEDRTWFVEANGPDEDDNVEGIVAKSVCAEKCEKHPHSPWQAVFFTQPPTKPT